MMALWHQSGSYTHFSTNINKENGISLAVLHRSGLHRNLKQHDHLQVENTMIKSGLSSRNRQLQEAEADEFCCWMRAELLQSCLTLCNAIDCSRQESSSMGFSRQEYWIGLPCPPPGDLPDPGIKPASLTSPALAGGFFTTSATWEPLFYGGVLFIPPGVLCDSYIYIWCPS